jgi:hypothetical protein
MINIVVTSKPVDGLLYYSYEYCTYLNEMGIAAQVVIICHRKFMPSDYKKVFTDKYIHFQNVVFDNVRPNDNDVNNIQFKHLFLGTNEKYYAAVEKVIGQFPDHGILTYDANYVNIEYNNIFVPVENIMGMFETYVYTKETFDPAPRIFQECKYYGKDVIYERRDPGTDGGTIYWKRDIKEPDITAILGAVKELK